MDVSTASLDLGGAGYLRLAGSLHTLDEAPSVIRPSSPPDAEHLRRTAWEIGERRAGDAYTPSSSHVGLGMVHPRQGFAYWRITTAWVEQTAKARGSKWDGARPILRLYDVSYIQFTGLNANRLQDEDLSGLVGQRFFNLPNAGTWQIAEVGFLLRHGEFLPAARSVTIPFAPESPPRHGGQAALLVQEPGRVEPVGTIWDAENEMRERRRPRLRHPLRIAALAFASCASGEDGTLAEFVTEMAQGQRSFGHEVHVLVPALPECTKTCEREGVIYHALPDVTGNNAIELAESFARSAEARLTDLPPFDLIHLHEWMTGLGSWMGHRPTVLSLSSIEATRRTGPADELSGQIEQIERKVARLAGCVLTPPWLRDRAVAELGLNSGRVHPFAMEGRLANEWEAPLDLGKVKMNFGVGPLDRVGLFVGPLEHAAGVDILLEALPVLLRRWGNLRLCFVGNGPMQGQLEHRARELGVDWAVRFLGHQSGWPLTQLVRVSEALILPSRYRIAMDDAVVDLARKAGRPVVTTHSGPAHLVRHEENGLITYDNPGSMVWAMDRILGDPGHAERMRQNGRRSEGGTLRWSEVARVYLESCVSWFPELSVTRKV